MRWLLHGETAPGVADVLLRHAHSIEPIEPAPTALDELLKSAHEKQLDVMTTDPLLVSVASKSPSRFDRSIVFLQLRGGGLEMVDAVERLFARYPRLTPGRLYTVTASRVKIRQLPGAHSGARR